MKMMLTCLAVQQNDEFDTVSVVTIEEHIKMIEVDINKIDNNQ